MLGCNCSSNVSVLADHASTKRITLPKQLHSSLQGIYGLGRSAADREHPRPSAQNDRLSEECGRAFTDNCFRLSISPQPHDGIRYDRVRLFGVTNECGFRDPLVHRPFRVLKRFSSGSRKSSSVLLNRREPAAGFVCMNRQELRCITPGNQAEEHAPCRIAFLARAVPSVSTREMLMTYEIVCNTRPSYTKGDMHTKVHCRRSHESAQGEGGLAFDRK